MIQPANPDIIYDDSNYHLLLFDQQTEDGLPQALPRLTEYGSKQADAMGLVPVTDDLDIPEWNDMKELIAWAHREKIFPMYHQFNTWINPDTGEPWNQNGRPYCWAWGLTGCCMDVEARDGRRKAGDPRLAPIFLGGAVRWRNVGYHLDGTIAYATRYGICEEQFVHDPHRNSESNLKEGAYENAQLHRPMEWWECNCRNVSNRFIAQQAMAIFRQASSCYIAHNWWGHALGLVALEWDESKPDNLIWVHRNSHRELKPIRLTGDKGSPSEIYGMRAMW